MTTISATSILASRHAVTGDRLDTLLLRYPRWIHAEGRTHRLMKIVEDMEISVPTPSLMEDESLSRNASSSRAIPVEKLIQDVLYDPAVPLFWGANQKGMQAVDQCAELVSAPTFTGGCEDLTNEGAWLRARDFAVQMARAFSEAGYHKQLVNRLLEPFSHITVVCSSTNWSNFLALRDHLDAEPHIQILAREIRKALDGAEVQELQPGEWHLPFVGTCQEDKEMLVLSAARCASTSYKTVDGFDMTIERAVALVDNLIGSTPMHSSPFEHVAQADVFENVGLFGTYKNRRQHGNFTGFRQWRKMLPNESL